MDPEKWMDEYAAAASYYGELKEAPEQVGAQWLSAASLAALYEQNSKRTRDLLAEQEASRQRIREKSKQICLDPDSDIECDQICRSCQKPFWEYKLGQEFCEFCTKVQLYAKASKKFDSEDRQAKNKTQEQKPKPKPKPTDQRSYQMDWRRHGHQQLHQQAQTPSTSSSSLWQPPAPAHQTPASSWQSVPTPPPAHQTPASSRSEPSRHWRYPGHGGRHHQCHWWNE